MSSCASYHENLLHWIWEHRQLDTRMLFTTAGKKVVIHDPGRPNGTDGPDFINAKITIDNLTWFGDVEIHWESPDWYRHGHQNDENYKGVILHVIFDDDSENSAKQAPLLPTLVMNSFLNKPLHSFFESFRSNKELPCSEKLSYISSRALNQQIEKAQRQYFEQKVDDLFHYYNPELKPSKAWQQLVVIALFDGLGISHNRTPMRKIARFLLKKSSKVATLSNLKNAALQEAGLSSLKKDNRFHWKRKGSRPANHPKVRICQGCELLWIIKKTPFSNWMKTDISKSFERCLQYTECNPGLGKQRSNVLFATVWLPAIYLLGNLFGSKKLASNAQKLWLTYRMPLPPSITLPFDQTDVPSSVYRRKLGTVHQLRAYCRSRQCHRCQVFKKVINS